MSFYSHINSQTHFCTSDQHFIQFLRVSPVTPFRQGTTYMDEMLSELSTISEGMVDEPIEDAQRERGTPGREEGE